MPASAVYMLVENSKSCCSAFTMAAACLVALRVRKSATKLLGKLGKRDYGGAAFYTVSCIPLLVLAVSVALLVWSGGLAPLLAMAGGEMDSVWNPESVDYFIFVIGQLGGKLLNKFLLKPLCAQQRPEGSGKEGANGMPSYHAQASFFAAAYLCRSAWSQGAALVVAVGVSYSRIYLEMHTWAQVAVGAVVGWLLGVALLSASGL